MRDRTSAGRQRYVDRDLMIEELARGQRVLHLGCVGHTDESALSRVALASETLHARLSGVADTTGVDNSTAVIDAYRASGVFSNIIEGDVQALDDLPLTGVFDVIVAGDIIEHLSNPGAMLDGMHRFCDERTRVIITTPNAFGLPSYLRFIAGHYREGAQHVMTFNSVNLRNLLNRHGYEVIKIITCHQHRARDLGAAFRMGRWFFNRFPKFGGTHFVVAIEGRMGPGTTRSDS